MSQVGVSSVHAQLRQTSLSTLQTMISHVPTKSRYYPHIKLVLSCAYKFKVLYLKLVIYDSLFFITLSDQSFQ